MVIRRPDITIERGVLPRSCFLVPSSYQQKGSRSMPSHFFRNAKHASVPGCNIWKSLELTTRLTLSHNVLHPMLPLSSRAGQFETEFASGAELKHSGV